MQSRIEYIEEYIVETADNPDGYNPPSFKWNDNHGELVRCKNCRYCEKNGNGPFTYWKCNLHIGLNRVVGQYEFCNHAEKEEK